MVLLIVITSLIFKKSFAWKLKLTLTKKGFKWRRYVPFLSRSGLFKLRSCSKLRSIDIPMYSVIWGGGQSFLGFPNTKREKLTQGRVFRRDICGLESWLSFRGKKHFHFSQFTILIFFCSVPREAPRHLKCDVLNSTAIRVRWSAPLQSQGGRIRGYVVFYTKVDDLGKELIPPEEAQVKFTASEHQLVRISS